MRVAASLLLLANVVVAAFLYFGTPVRPTGLTQGRTLELNADRIKRVQDDAPGASRAAAGACMEWGPLAGDELVRARDELAKLNVAKTSVRPALDTPVWWVHLPPVKTRDEAERRVRELEELGVRDARVVTEDAWRNAVSLGIFRSEEAAAARQARLREIKVRNAAVVQRSDLIRFSTIVINDPSAQAAARIAALATAFAGSEVKAVACMAGEG